MGELKAIDGKLSQGLRRDLGVEDGFPVFIPYATYTKGGRTVSVRLIEGYAFVASGLPETRYFALERHSLVAKVFSISGPRGLRVLQTIPDTKITEMRRKLQEILCSDIEIGSLVRIIGGNYSHMEGRVVDVFDDRVAIRIALRSIDTITIVPRSLVEVDGDHHTYGDNMSAIDEVSIDDIDETVPWGRQ